MTNSNFFIVGKHPVTEALKNPVRKVIRVFLTEESKKTINRENQNLNLLKDIKVYFKTKKELDNYCKMIYCIYRTNAYKTLVVEYNLS